MPATRPCALMLRLLLANMALMPLIVLAEEMPLEIHVSTAGDNANAGTAEKPVATLPKAIARLAAARDAGRDIAIVLHDGTYQLAEPIVLRPEILPAGNHTVSFRAATGASPLISGGRRITGWKRSDDGTLRTMIPDVASGKWRFRELFIGDKRCPRARHPNAGFVRIDRSLPDRRSGFTIHGGDLPKTVQGDAELVFLHDWSISRIRIATIDHDKLQLRTQHPIGSSAPHYAIDNFEAHPRYYIEDHPALLDAPGEWRLDAAKGELTYFPREGETAENLQAVAPAAPALLIAQGNDSQPIRNVHVQGIAFMHCDWQLPPEGYADGQATWHDRRDGSAQAHSRKLMPAAIHFERAEDCSIDRCHIAHLGAGGVWFGSRTKNCRLSRSTLEDISGNCVNLGEDAGRRIDGRHWWQIAPQEAGSGHVVADNIIRRGGQQFYGAVGIWAGLVREITIEHNEVAHLPYTGISLGWMWNPTPTPAGMNTVANNHIHHVMQILSDGGGIYTLGRQPGTRLVGNYIHDVPLNSGRAESNGMFLDEGTDQIVIAGNVIHRVARSPLRFHRAQDNDVKDNVLVVPNDQTPTIRYNSTDAATIKQSGNRTLEEAKFDVESVRGTIEATGPQKE